MVWLATAGVVSAGSVQTVDGRRLQGELQFAAEALSVTAAGASESIPLTNVLSAEFLTPEAEEPGGSGAGNGLLGFYFSNTNLAGAPFVRLDESIQFNWTSGEAAPGIPADRFSVVWCGEVEAPVSGEFRFSLAADDSALHRREGVRRVERHLGRQRRWLPDPAQDPGQRWRCHPDPQGPELCG